MRKSRDLFDDTTMTFGEHLEVLRVHVFRALLGVILAVSVCLFFGDRIFLWLRHPVEKALRDRGIENVTMDAPKQSFYEWAAGFFTSKETPQPTEEEKKKAEEKLKNDQLKVRISRTELEKALGQPPSPPPVTDTQDPAKPAYVEIILTAPEFAQLQRVIEDTSRITTFKVEEGFMAYMKVCFFSGLLLSSPWIFYQLWLFVSAGLYPHERKYVHVYLPMSVVLFLAGAAAGYFYAFPLMLDFLIGFNAWLGITVQPRLSEYISMAMLMPILFGVSFQLPLVMVFLERIGICTVNTYKDNWRIAVLIISIASMVLTTSPDPWSMLLMMFPLLLLYVLGIYLCQFRIGSPPKPIR
ncbi:MAG: twin-arginine translocase subunit TatC [Planctomycetaceae bacterium]|nr:twin-arginine translocase subunit TatC [Planctomycetaceae bacterium]